VGNHDFSFDIFIVDSRKIPHPLFPKTPKEWDSSTKVISLFTAIKSITAKSMALFES
jgi:hypothetical protein